MPTGALRSPDAGPPADGQRVSFPEAFVAAAAAGDREAVARLLEMLRPMVVRYCRGRLGVQECAVGCADDVAQEVCLAVLSALPGYRVNNGSFRAFVYGIAAHKVADAYRAAGRNRSEPAAELPDTAATSDGPEAQAIRAELGEQLHALLSTLTVRQREVLLFRVVDGLSAEETAETVGSTEGAVRVIQHRALNKLRSLLSGRSDEARPAASAGSPVISVNGAGLRTESQSQDPSAVSMRSPQFGPSAALTRLEELAEGAERR